MSATFGGAAALDPVKPEPSLSEKFSDRARALFYARLALLAIGLCILAIPAWSRFLGTTSSAAFLVYFAIISYSCANYLLIDHPRLGRPLTYWSLVLDFGALALVAAVSGGLKSPLMGAHVMLTIFLVLLFPRLTSVVPSLLMLLLVPQLSASIYGEPWGSDVVFLIVWYATLALVAAYVLRYLHMRDERRNRALTVLSKSQEAAIVTEERLRLARDMHDGIGGNLSTLIIQAEFLQRVNKDESITEEIDQLKGEAEEAIEELRRSLTMMRRDFDLHKALEDYCMRFQERSRVWCELKIRGRTRRLPSDMQLAIFRMLQETLNNVQKHAKADNVSVKLKYDGDMVTLLARDDGVGFDLAASKSGHYGLTNMTERAKKFRGTVDLQSAPGDGTTVHVTLVVPIEGSHVAFFPQA